MNHLRMNHHSFTHPIIPHPDDSFETRKQSFLEELNHQTDQTSLHGYLIRKGQTLPLLPHIRNLNDTLITGCLNNIWLKHQIIEDKLFFEADSDSKIIKGAIAILRQLLSGLPCNQIAQADLEFLYQGPFKDLFQSTRFNSARSIQQRLKHQCLLSSGTSGSASSNNWNERQQNQ